MYNNNDQIIGVPDKLYYGQYERIDELNNRITSRQFPDNPLEPNYDLRPVATKYALYPILDRQPKSASDTEYKIYNISNFNPSTKMSPVSGYFSNIDTETKLRNQTEALQHGAVKGVYIPSSNSDLYNTTVISNYTIEQPYPGLFTRTEFSNQIHPNLQYNSIGNDIFNNHTRTQLRTNSFEHLSSHNGPNV